VNIALPLWYPTSMAWRYEAPADATGITVGIQSPTLGLDAATSYAASVFLKEIVTDKASLNVHWPADRWKYNLGLSPARDNLFWDGKPAQ